ncbi:unnamed protein product, partial [Closterium sp. Naga37s-1]
GGDVGGHGCAVHFITPAPPSLPLPPPLARQVAEMRGGMAVLSDASTGTTILLALPLGGGEDAGSTGVREENGEALSESAEAGQESAERESELQEGAINGPAAALPHAAAASVQPALPPQRPAAGVRALVRARTCPVEMKTGTGVGEGVGEAERVVRGVVAGRGVAVVDDNVVNRMVARRTLQGYGAHVLLFPSGEDALQALSSATPSLPIHLLLLDLHMPPGIDGSVPRFTSPSPLFNLSFTLLHLFITSPLPLLHLPFTFPSPLLSATNISVSW